MRGFQIRQITGDEKSSVDIVFVHGLTGHEQQTWDRPRSIWERLRLVRSGRQGDNTKELWPARRLGSSARVWLAGYPSPLLEVLHGGKVSQAFAEEADEALRVLQRRGLGAKPIIFVAHSLGGLLVKALLCRSAQHFTEDINNARRSIVKATAAVVFLATPHAGSHRVRLRLWIPHLVRSLGAALVVFLSFMLEPVWLSAPIVSVGNQAVTGQVIVRVMSVVVVTLALWSLRAARHVYLLDPGNPELRTLRDDFRKDAAGEISRLSADCGFGVVRESPNCSAGHLGVLVERGSRS
jgi:pimeloyl-ACP methyl ester carboxylesterase